MQGVAEMLVLMAAVIFVSLLSIAIKFCLFNCHTLGIQKEFLWLWSAYTSSTQSRVVQWVAVTLEKIARFKGCKFDVNMIGDVISKFDGDNEENVAEEEQALTTSNNSNNNNGSQEEVEDAVSSPTRRMSEGFERVSGRRSSVKLLQRQESTTSQAPMEAV
ncbi:hypothetical protein AC249_AIPGENE24783 [Exaiptasia diaphana]|nr:hypothetical protein AC249_AIPGENE24783 [Exaiptasia diaphana]